VMILFCKNIFRNNVALRIKRFLSKALLIAVLSVFIPVNLYSEMLIESKLVNFGYRTASTRNVTAIIVHSTFNNSGGEKYDVDLIISQFQRYGVSSHYLIGRDGRIFLLVHEKDVAFHAGKSELPNGSRYVNSLSIGIELITSFDDSPTVSQINALVQLVKDIRSRHAIEYILRHSDIAPGRKTDPWNMNWDEFLKEIE
jgi:N-acetylmuramoyl-L-alanine amidase